MFHYVFYWFVLFYVHYVSGVTSAFFHNKNNYVNLYKNLSLTIGLQKL